MWMLVAALVVMLSGLGLYLWLSFRWPRNQTRRDQYFARPIAERRDLETQIAKRARVFVPIAGLQGHIAPKPAFSHKFRGVAFNPMICPRETFEAATRHQPVAGDIFVATQMKCGTTWMQQVVYELLLRGAGDLGDSGHRHLYAISPWSRIHRSGFDADCAPRGTRYPFDVRLFHPLLHAGFMRRKSRGPARPAKARVHHRDRRSTADRDFFSRLAQRVRSTVRVRCDRPCTH